MSIFESLRAIIADATATGTAPAFADDDYRLATVALLVHVANVDGVVDPTERTRLRDLIETRFGLDAAATTQLIEQAEQSDREAVDFYHFTSVLKRSLDSAGRHRIIEMMWDIVFADGVVSEFEENVVWRVAELLGVPTRDRVALRHKVAEEPRPAPVEGPWSSPAPPKKS